MMENNSYNPIVKKKELINIIYINYNKAITENEIRNIIDSDIELGDKNDRIYCFNKERVLLSKELHIELLDEAVLSKDFKEIYYFKIDDDKYIYFYSKPNDEKDLNYIKQIDYILNNNLNEGKNDDLLKYMKFSYVKYLDDFKEYEKPLEVKFKEYDYIKVICDNNNYSDIGIKDIKKCIDFLNYHQEHNYLTVEEQVSLRLIILLGIKNIYLNNTEYYKESHIETINSSIENINDNILFIKENIDNIKNEIKYSFNREYPPFNLKKYCSNIFVYLDDNYTVWNRNISLYEKIDNEFISFLRYINFDYYVSNNKFEEAKKIYEKNLPLFKYLKESQYTSKHMICELLFVVLGKIFKYNEKEKHENIKLLSDILSDTDDSLLYDYFYKFNIDSAIKRNIKVMLKLYISCYYYFKHFKDNEKANKVYEYLLYFKKGYDIEDFIIKCKYIKMIEDIGDLKIENINDTEKIDKAVELMHKKITEMKIINTFDEEDVIISYPHINFNNLDDRVKTYIATAEKIINIINNDKNKEYDYSCAVIEWSKAVELEINNKFISKISKYKYDIEKYSRERNPYAKKHFKLDTPNATIGIFKAIRKYKLQHYLYDNYFSQLYTFDKDIYNKLCEYIIAITQTRNDSAHKDYLINVVTANDCKNKILNANKILEILSKLEKV